MRLFELSNPNPLLVRLVAVTSQLTSEIDSGDQHSDWTVDELLQYYKDNDIILAKQDLYDMIKKPPLNQSIENIQGDKVIFKGQTPEQEQGPDENQKIVAQMAQNAMQQPQ
jgi:hypothetical protein